MKLFKIIGLIILFLFFFKASYLEASSTFTFPEANIQITWDQVYSKWFMMLSAYDLWVIPPKYQKYIKWEVYANWTKIYEAIWEDLLFYPENSWEHIIILYNNNIEVDNKIIMVEDSQLSSLEDYNLKEIFLYGDIEQAIDITSIETELLSNDWVYIRNNSWSWEITVWDNVTANLYIKYSNEFNYADIDVNFPDNLEFVDAEVSDSFIDIWTNAWVKATGSNVISIIWNIEQSSWSFVKENEKLITLNFKAKKNGTWFLSIWSNLIYKVLFIQDWGFYTEETSLSDSYIDYNIKLKQLNFIENATYNKYINDMLEVIDNLPVEEKIGLLKSFVLMPDISWSGKVSAVSQSLSKQEIASELKTQVARLLFNLIELNKINLWDIDVLDASNVLTLLSYVKDVWIDDISSDKLYPFTSVVSNQLLTELNLLDKSVVEISTISWNLVSWKALLVPTWVVSKDIVIESADLDSLEALPKIKISFWTQIKKKIGLVLSAWENAILQPIRQHSMPSNLEKLDEISMWKFNTWKTYSFAGSNTQEITFWTNNITLLLPKIDLVDSDLDYLKFKYFDYQNYQWIEDTWVTFELNPQTPDYLSVENLSHATEFVIWKDNSVPNALFTTNTLAWSSPLEVNFNWSFSSDADWSIESYEWDFWDGTVWSWPNVSHTYNSIWSYSAILTVRDNNWLDDSQSVLISITNTAPVSNFTMDNPSWEVPLLVTFDASSASDQDWHIALYEWDLWDGTTAIWKIVTHKYTTVWSFTAKLKVADNNWLEWLYASVITVSNKKPVSNFDVNIKEWSAPLVVTFNGTKSTDDDWTVVSHTWDFWDWTSWNSSIISHIFAETWDFEVKLTVKDNTWLTWSSVKVISVFPTRKENIEPKATFIQSVKEWKSPLTVSFDASKSTDTDWDIARFKWYFRDWSVWYWPTITHKYIKNWEFEVLLEVRDDIWWVWISTWLITVINAKPVASFESKAGSANNKIFSFDATKSKDEEWEIVQYNWDYWDWVYWKWVTANHEYKISWKFKVKLTVENWTKQKWEIIKEIEVVNNKPVANLTLSNRFGPAPLKIYFDARKSTDSDWNIVLYKWDFWDKNVGEWLKVDHTFISSWDYDVSLIVTDNLWATSEKKVQISVGNQKSFVSIATDKTQWPTPLKVSFDGSASVDKDWSIVSYDWDFGDWTKWKWVKLSHEYKKWWEFIATLSVVDNYWEVSSKSLKIKSIVSAPVSDFTFKPTTWPAPLKVNFNASASKNLWWKIVSYQWDFWNMSTWTWKAISHEFKQDWNYLISLKVINDQWISWKIIKNLLIKNKQPVSLFSISSDSADSLSINFDGKMSKDEDWSIISHDWDFGDWTRATSGVKQYKYAQEWSYIVTLNVKDDHWSSNTIANEVVVKPWEKPVVKDIDSAIANLDWDKDWKIDLKDFFLFVRKYSDKQLNKEIDLNKDDKKNTTDLSIFMYLYNKGK